MLKNVLSNLARRSIGFPTRETIATNKQKNELPTRNFDPRLSGLRGVAALSVVIYHALNYFSYSLPTIALVSLGYLGVPIFLMLSMFLLLNSLKTRPDLKHYFKRRILRIWPIYYGSIISFYFLFHIPFWDFVRYLFFVEYYVNPLGYMPATIFWTLQLEEAVYLLIPMISRLKANQKIVLASIVTFVGATFLFGYGYFLNKQGYDLTYLQTFIPVAGFAYGLGLFAYCGKISSHLRWLALIGISGLAFLNFVNPMKISSAPNPSTILFYCFALVGFSAIVAHPPNILSKFTILGEESYALYAIHVSFYHGVWVVRSPIRFDICISHRVLSQKARYYSTIENRVFASGIERLA